MADLLNPGGGSPTLEDVATNFLQGQAANPTPDTGPKMIVAGGKVMGQDVSHPNWGQQMNQGLTQLSQAYLMSQQLKKKHDFFQSAHTIATGPDSPEDKKQKMLDLIMQHQGEDYGTGLKEVLVKELGQPGMPVYKTDASGNLIQVGTVQRGSHILPAAKTGATGTLEQLGIATEGKTQDQLTQELKTKNPLLYTYLDSVGKGNQPIMGRFGMAANQVSELVTALFPQYDPSVYPAREHTRRDFTSGKSAQNIRSLNTATEHLSELVNLIPTLGNGQLMKANSVKNWLMRNAGQTGVARFNFVKAALSGELSTLFKNSGGTDQEINNLRQAIDTADSPQNLYDVLSKGAPALMKGRMDALDWQWKTAFKNPEDQSFPIMSPQSQKFFEKIGVIGQEPGAAGAGQRVKVKSPQGQTGTIPAEQLQDALSQGYIQVQ